MSTPAFQLVIADAEIIQLYHQNKMNRAIKRAQQVAGLMRRDASDMLTSEWFAEAIKELNTE